MKPRLTLNRAWELCLAQWEPMIKAYHGSGSSDIVFLKRKHFPGCGFDADDFREHCFFCEYDRSNMKENPNEFLGACINCPGVLADSKFECNHGAYNYSRDP
ncbi:hypothetical protein LCGC14_2691900 [marine sediment metagenome]|uniref:Uncharacterized protein n=1 Tax=marine sediment metagenome TaxID=412755 RepID=A0A0F8ZID3_9ZZZZ